MPEKTAVFDEMRRCIEEIMRCLPEILACGADGSSAVLGLHDWLRELALLISQAEAAQNPPRY